MGSPIQRCRSRCIGPAAGLQTCPVVSVAATIEIVPLPDRTVPVSGLAVRLLLIESVRRIIRRQRTAAAFGQFFVRLEHVDHCTDIGVPPRCTGLVISTVPSGAPAVLAFAK